jgi:adenine-specific DNA-methyltransferase
MSELQSQFTGQSSLLDVPNTSAGTQEIREIFDSDVFDFPKPLELIKLLIRQSTSEEDIILDFFAGSAPVGHAVLDVNRELGENRQFILVQIPEETEDKSPAKTAGYETIASIAKERIRRVIDQMQTEDESKLDLRPDEDLGFKVFKLAPSAFREWERPESAAALQEQLSYFDVGLKDGAHPAHALYEVLLKQGYSLNARIQELDLPANQVYRICQPEGVDEGDRCFYLCLDDDLAPATTEALPLDDQTVFICQDAALDDSQKVNLALGCILKTL